MEYYKFRIWEPHTKRMYYDSEIAFIGNKSPGNAVMSNNRPIIKPIIMISICDFDINNKEIYLDDLVKSKFTNKVYRVVWDKKNKSIGLLYRNKIFSFNSILEIEVISNIYEKNII